MAMYAVLSDIHGNYEALREVERDARGEALKKHEELRFICLGDVVDYGPQPNECAEWVRDHVREEMLVLGNHDEVVATPSDKSVQDINEKYWAITLWTRRVLKKGYREWFRKWPIRRELSTSKEDGHFTLFHGSLWGNNDRIDGPHVAARNIRRMGEDEHYGLFGHTHYQGYFEERWEGKAQMFLVVPEVDGGNGNLFHRNRASWRAVNPSTWQELPKYSRVLFNPGSVGQPRTPPQFAGLGIQCDERAAYMLIRVSGNEKEFCFRRVDYDVHETVRQLRNLLWPIEDATMGGSDIYRDSWLPDDKRNRLRYILEHGQETLEDLVRDELIPILNCAHNGSK